jgi:hypothetical protein
VSGPATSDRPWFRGLFLLLLLPACRAPAPPERDWFPAFELRAPLFSAPQILADAARDNFGEQPRSVVIAVNERSSLRAVDEALRRVRDAGRSAAYWIEAPVRDSGTGAGAALDADQRLAHARTVLRDRRPADAWFVAGLQGAALPCGCSETLCAAQDAKPDPLAAARFVRALAGFADGAPLIPVWCDRGPDSALSCSAEACAAAGCGALERRAFAALREATRHLALAFEPSVLLAAGAPGEASAYVARRLSWAAARPSSGPATAAGATLAVLPVRDLAPESLQAAVAGVRATPRGGWVLVHAPLRDLGVP